MICPSCKTKNQYYHRFCYYCGYKLDTPKAALESTKTEPPQELTQPEKEYKQAESTKPEELNESQETKSNEVYDSSTGEIEKIDETQEAGDIEENEVQEAEENGEQGIEPVTNSQQSLYNYLFDGHTTNDFDISREIPLRRYRKDRSSRKPKRLAKLCIPIFTTALVIFVIIVLLQGTVNNMLKQPANSQNITVSTVVKPVDKDGNPAHQIIFNTTNGKEVKILNTSIPVEDGRAEVILEDSLLHSLDPVEGENGILEAHLDSIISAPGFSDKKETISIQLNQSYAPLNLIQPSSGEAAIEGDSFQLVLAVEPGSQVFINDNDYTDLVNEEGKLIREIEIPSENDEISVTIRVSLKGFADSVREVVLRRPVMEVPITINQTSPIPSQGQWVKISGTTLPGAALTANREIKEDPEVNPETGQFTMDVRATHPGYTPCILTAELDGKVSSMEIILDGETSIDTYTSTAWKPEYDKMQQTPALHNGRHFLFRGTVRDIITTGQKNVFTVNTSDDSDSEQLIRVEYWGNNFSFDPGDKIRVFGNRWGNIEDMPRILAKYIYE